LDEIIRHTTTWLNRFERTWFRDLEAAFAQRLDRAEVQQLREKFQEAEGLLSRLSTAAANGQQVLHRQLRR
jgi:hypothetical protein